MPVTRSRPRLLSLVFVVSGVFFCYLVFLAEVAVHQKRSDRRNSDSESRKIVAFSLLKQIEIESEEFHCGDNFLVGEEATKLRQDEYKLWTHLEGTNIFIYSVYRDRRLYPYEYIRIIAMVKGSWNNTLFCQMSSSSGHYHITKAKATKIWSKIWNQNDSHVYYNPFLISCLVSIRTSPDHLSLSTKPCKQGLQRFKLPVPNDKEISKKYQNSFTICVKPLNFAKDVSEKLLQWITINKILGATKIELYIGNLPKKMSEVLEIFRKNLNGVLVLHRHTQLDSGFVPDDASRVWQKRRHEIVTYNDCLYRNIHTSQFIIPIDIDEIIVPRHVTTWAELLHETLSEGEDNFASYTVRNAYYLRQFNTKKLKEKIFFFRNVIRSEFSEERESGKSFISTKNALTVFNHYALRTLRPDIGRNKFLKKELVQMNHYKDDCDAVILPECAKYLASPVRVVDNVIFKYKKAFYKEYVRVLALFNQKVQFSDIENIGQSV